jgi:two-component sensor histidine kinase/Tfp pilus assembly protein PilF
MKKLKHIFVHKHLILVLGFFLSEFNLYSNDNEIYKLLNLTQSALNKSSIDSANFYISQAESFIKPESSSGQKAEVKYWSGRTLYASGKYEEADKKFESAIDFALISADTLLIADCYNDLGRTYKKRAKYSKALSAFNLARQYFFAAGNETGIAKVHLNVGNILKEIGRTDLAKIEYWSALHTFKKNNDQVNEASCYNNLGNIYKNEGLYDSAFHYMYLTLALREKETALYAKSQIYHNLANLHIIAQSSDSAIYYITKAIEINQKISSKEDLASDYNTFGSIYIKLKDWNKAIFYLENAHELVANDFQSNIRLDILRQLGYAYHQIGNSKKSSDSFLAYFTIKDSFNVSSQESFIEDELIRYELFADSIKSAQLNLEKDLETVKKENTALSNQINFRNYTYAIVILLLLISLIAILFISARRRLSQTMQHEAVLQVQNEELKRTLISKEEKEVLLKEVHHRVKNNLQIINSLIRLQSNFMNAKNFKEKLVETENRIRSMALIHEKLYKTGNLASLSVRNYIEELAINILESYENHNVNIKLKFDLEDREYGIDTLIPLGLIINETLSNAIKHAFYERTEGNIWISIHSNGPISHMKIKDDGIGADLTFDELKEDSLGLELIDSLTDQLDGKLDLNTETGFEYSFEFRILK